MQFILGVRYALFSKINFSGKIKPTVCCLKAVSIFYCDKILAEQQVVKLQLHINALNEVLKENVLRSCLKIECLELYKGQGKVNQIQSYFKLLKTK